MNTRSASPAEERLNQPSGVTATRKVLVWDAPVRVFHWLMVLSFAGAYLTAESEQWRLVHVTLGYTMAGLVGFRILWGLFGTRHARFSTFVRGPAAIARYLRAMLRGQPDHYTGHNPAGALVIVVLLGLTLAVAASGWAAFNEVGGNWLEESHEVAANLMLAVVGLHVTGVLLSSWLHRENLIGAMITGRKAGQSNDRVRSAWRSVAVIMLVAVLGFWRLQWQGAPPASDASVQATSADVKQHDRRHN
jgi:cytochrome b